MQQSKTYLDDCDLETYWHYMDFVLPNFIFIQPRMSPLKLLIWWFHIKKRFWRTGKREKRVRADLGGGWSPRFGSTVALPRISSPTRPSPTIYFDFEIDEVLKIYKEEVPKTGMIVIGRHRGDETRKEEEKKNTVRPKRRTEKEHSSVGGL